MARRVKLKLPYPVTYNMPISRILTVGGPMMVNISADGFLDMSVNVNGEQKYLTVFNAEGVAGDIESLYNDILSGRTVITCVMGEIITASHDGDHVVLGRLRPWWRNIGTCISGAITMVLMLGILLTICIGADTPAAATVMLGVSIIWMAVLQYSLVAASHDERPQLMTDPGV